MQNNMLFVGWNRPVAGRERQALEHFQEFLTYLGKQQQQTTITGFTPVMLQAHGRELTGFIVINGEADRLNKLTNEEIFQEHVARASALMLNFSVLPAYTGKEMDKQMQRYAKYI